MINRSKEIASGIGSKSLEWWKELQPRRNPPEWWEESEPSLRPDRRERGNTGALARLRRADLADAAVEEVTATLYRKLASVTRLDSRLLFERAALIAAVLSHVRDLEENRSIASAAGQKVGDQLVFHPLRLKRLFAARTQKDCLPAFRRLIAVLGKKGNVSDLAESLFDWTDEAQGDKRRIYWAFDYYDANSAAPEEAQITL